MFQQAYVELHFKYINTITGLDRPDTADYVCTVYFGKSAPCLGGILALDGKTGETIWTHWTSHAVFSVDCGLDLNSDEVKDCLISGRGGVLQLVDGRNGTLKWEYRDMLRAPTFYDVYDGKYISDIDGDGIADVIASHSWQSGTVQSEFENSQSELVLIFGNNGSEIHRFSLSAGELVFVSPQVIVHPDGETYFILAASDKQNFGGLYYISRSQLLKGDLVSKIILTIC